MKRKRILHFISGLEIGGAENQLLRILPELQKHHENAVCCARGRGPVGKALEEKNISVYYLELENFFDFPAVLRFRKIIKDFSPDLLVTYLIHADLYGRIWGRLFGIKKIICSKRGALLQWEWLSFFDRLTKKLVDHYLVQTDAAKNEWMKKLKLSKEKFTVIPNGIDVNEFKFDMDRKKKMRELKINGNPLIITCVSKLRRGKGHRVLLEAFEKIYAKNIVLLIVGDGEKEIELKNYANNFASKNKIFFLGHRSDISEILAVSDIFILPTEKEGMSNALIEAMIAGLPIITTDIPENRALIKNKESGIFFPVNDVNSLNNKIELLISNLDLRQKLGRCAQQEAGKKFDIKIITQKYAEFYNTV
jgi:glycosyltransferase involved in cell wall biosynthesis